MVLCATDDEDSHVEAAQLRVKTMAQARNQGNFERALELAATEAERATILDYSKEVRVTDVTDVTDVTHVTAEAERATILDYSMEMREPRDEERPTVTPTATPTVILNVTPTVTPTATLNVTPTVAPTVAPTATLNVHRLSR